MRYIQYNLLQINGEGHQPYGAVAAAGATLEGGHFAQNGRMVGYLSGSDAAIEAALLALTPWGVKELSGETVLAHAEACERGNAQDAEGLYVGPAELAPDGRVRRERSKKKFVVKATR